MQHMEARLGSLEGAFTQVADRLNGIDMRLNSIDARIDVMRRDFDQRFTWVIGIVVTSWVTTVLAIFFHH